MIYIYRCPDCGYEVEFKEKAFSEPSENYCPECDVLLRRKILMPRVNFAPPAGYNNYGVKNPDWKGVHGFHESTIEAYQKMHEEDKYLASHGIKFEEDA